ncbi:MAG: diaminopimelate epimerase, partial [Christensenellaceae bacterium]|nr:diaminopimelate epimerase [Christensenellaceae bacterium]
MFFTKMHGAGNDFIIIDNRNGEVKDAGTLAAKLCARRLNIGADGLVLVEDSEIADTRMRIINADGSEAEMCGNGIRCFARFVYDEKIVGKEEFTVETLAGIMIPKMILADGKVSGVRVDMGIPSFAAEDIPMKAENTLRQRITAAGKSIEVSSVLMGVPHTVVFAEDGNVSWEDFDTVAPAVEKHDIYPKNTNVNFAEVIDRDHVRVRTWERGAGATMACGTGACAAAAVMLFRGMAAGMIEIELEAG